MKTFIKSREGKRICVVIEEAVSSGKLAFVMHGLGGYKEQPHIRAMVEAFLELGYSVVSFDTRNTFGESEGNYEDATISNYYADLEDVINWSKLQPWYAEPFILSGHSLGGISVAQYAENFPANIAALAPISTVVAWKLSIDTPKSHARRESLEKWERDGILISKPGAAGKVKRLKWAHIEDRRNYDLLPGADRLTMPVLMVVGSADENTPPEHQKILYDKLPGKKEMHIIKGAAHDFNTANELAELKEYFKDWLQKL